MLALDFLGVPFAWAVLVGVQMPGVGTPMIGGVAGEPEGLEQCFELKWLRVLGTTETPHIDQGVRHQFHPVVALLDVLETEQQPLAFVLPRKRPLDALS